MSTLADLFPTSCTLVIHTLRKAGISTKDWTANDDPSRRNNWSFGRVGEPQILFIWHDELYVEDGQICFKADMQEHAIALERANTPRSRRQATRAREFHGRVTRAYFQRLPIRVALVDGPVDDEGVAKVKNRVLDDVTWYAHSRDTATASVILKRGIELPKDFDPSAEYLKGSSFEPVVDLLPSEPESAPARYIIGTTTFARDSEVVKEAKVRAGGVCEYCGKRGFETFRGGF